MDKQGEVIGGDSTGRVIHAGPSRLHDLSVVEFGTGEQAELWSPEEYSARVSADERMMIPFTPSGAAIVIARGDGVKEFYHADRVVVRVRFTHGPITTGDIADDNEDGGMAETDGGEPIEPELFALGARDRAGAATLVRFRFVLALRIAPYVGRYVRDIDDLDLVVVDVMRRKRELFATVILSEERRDEFDDIAFVRDYVREVEEPMTNTHSGLRSERDVQLAWTQHVAGLRERHERWLAEAGAPAVDPAAVPSGRERADVLEMGEVRYRVALVVAPHVGQYLRDPGDLCAVVDDVAKQLLDAVGRREGTGRRLDYEQFFRTYVLKVQKPATGQKGGKRNRRRRGDVAVVDLEWLWMQHAYRCRERFQNALSRTHAAGHNTETGPGRS